MFCTQSSFTLQLSIISHTKLVAIVAGVFALYHHRSIYFSRRFVSIASFLKTFVVMDSEPEGPERFLTIFVRTLNRKYHGIYSHIEESESLVNYTVS